MDLHMSQTHICFIEKGQLVRAETSGMFLSPHMLQKWTFAQIRHLGLIFCCSQRNCLFFQGRSVMWRCADKLQRSAAHAHLQNTKVQGR